MDPQTPCSEEHLQFASEWHKNGTLCDAWLTNLERGQFSPSQCNEIRSMVWSDHVLQFGRLDRGQLIRLDVSLSRTLPPKRTWFLSKVGASLGPFKGEARFKDENRDANGK